MNEMENLTNSATAGYESSPSQQLAHDSNYFGNRNASTSSSFNNNLSILNGGGGGGQMQIMNGARDSSGFGVGAASLTTGTASSVTGSNYTTSNSLTGGANLSSTNYKEKHKIGHREIKDGVVHYKKISTDELKKSIQFGIVHFINEQNRFNMDRDLLMQDFQVVETVIFPKGGSTSTPAHDYNDFKLKVYAPYGFRYLRRKFNVNEVDFMHALGETDLKEVSNPGASGSIFYKTSNDKYILKTVQYQECEFLKQLLAGYTLNLLQNLINQKFSLLPTIYGLFCYQKLELASMLSDKTNIRVVIMNNILPSDVPIHEKYDLKGSLYKRKANRQERLKNHPTFKDLDFLEQHPEGIQLEERHYENIIGSIRRDCMVLESFGIMDYSLLLGIHNLEREKNNIATEAYFEAKVGDPSSNSNAIANSSTPSMASSNINSQHRNVKYWDTVFNISAVPARSGKGERLLLYFGIIDILQSYRLKKKLEHTFKSMIADGRQISVCHPKFYAARFIDFMTQKVFKRATLKSSPIRKRLTFKLDPKKGGVNEESSQPTSPIQEGNEPIDSFENARYNQTTPSRLLNPSLNNNDDNNPPSPPATSLNVTTHNASFRQNLKNIKPIDSIDSVAGLLVSSDSKSKIAVSSGATSGPNLNTNTINNAAVSTSSQSKPSQYQSKFNQITETDQDTSSSGNDKFQYGQITSDNDAKFLGPVESRRTPIKIIDHYASSTTTSANRPAALNQQQQISASSISIKIETHSPVHLKSTNNLLNESLENRSTITTTSSPSTTNAFQFAPPTHSPTHLVDSITTSPHKFNGESVPYTTTPSSINYLTRYTNYENDNSKTNINININGNNKTNKRIASNEIEIITPPKPRNRHQKQHYDYDNNLLHIDANSCMDLDKYVKINRTEFTVKDRLRSRPSVLSKRDISINDADIYDYTKFDSKQLYDRYRTENVENYSSTNVNLPYAEHCIYAGHSLRNLLENSHYISHASQNDYNKVTSFTVDKSLIKRNLRPQFQHDETLRNSKPHLVRAVV